MSLLPRQSLICVMHIVCSNICLHTQAYAFEWACKPFSSPFPIAANWTVITRGFVPFWRFSKLQATCNLSGVPVFACVHLLLPWKAAVCRLVVGLLSPEARNLSSEGIWELGMSHVCRRRGKQTPVPLLATPHYSDSTLQINSLAGTKNQT